MMQALAVVEKTIWLTKANNSLLSQLKNPVVFTTGFFYRYIISLVVQRNCPVLSAE